MNNLTKTLLGGVAITALTPVAANAANLHPAFHVTALHGGRVINKTKIHDPGRSHVVYTFSVYTSVPGTVGTTTKLAATYYKWNSSGNLCTKPVEKIKVRPRKTTYGLAGTSTETYSEGCSSGPTTFYGDTYTLKKAEGEGQIDFFVSTLTGLYQNGGARTRYKGTLNLDVSNMIEHP